MSKSFKGEERAQARAVQQRRTARRSKHDNFRESHDSSLESKSQARTMPTRPVDASPAQARAWTPFRHR
jgi:hypothetical protein